MYSSHIFTVQKLCILYIVLSVLMYDFSRYNWNIVVVLNTLIRTSVWSFCISKHNKCIDGRYPSMTEHFVFMLKEPSYGNWIYNYMWNRCLIPLTLWVRIPFRRCVLDTILWDQVCQWLATSLWFSSITPVSSTKTTDLHDITEI